MTVLRPIILAIAATSLSVFTVPAAKAQSDASDPYGKTASQASATSENGFYATVGLGGAWPQNVTGNTTILGVGVNGSYGLGGGFSGEIGAGYDFGPVRTELWRMLRQYVRPGSKRRWRLRLLQQPIC